MWVQPKVRQPIFSLKPIRATTYRFYFKKNLRSRAAFFLLEQFFFQQKSSNKMKRKNTRK